MNTQKHIEHMLRVTLLNNQERLLMRCYVLRRILGQTPRQVAKDLGLTPGTVSSYAQRAAIIFGLNEIDSKDNIYNIVMRSCENLVNRERLRAHRNHARTVAERMTNKLIETA